MSFGSGGSALSLLARRNAAARAQAAADTSSRTAPGPTTAADVAQPRAAAAPANTPAPPDPLLAASIGAMQATTAAQRQRRKAVAGTLVTGPALPLRVTPTRSMAPKTLGGY
jgi:hypothetical protein